MEAKREEGRKERWKYRRNRRQKKGKYKLNRGRKEKDEIEKERRR